MFYPEEFKLRVKKAYPHNTTLHEKLDSDDDFCVGRFLRKGYSKTISFDFILNSDSFEELKNFVRLQKERNALYEEWMDMY